MALPTTGSIGHVEIMAEFEKTGKFDLSADGASLIDKSPSTPILETDFYGAQNGPVYDWNTAHYDGNGMYQEFDAELGNQYSKYHCRLKYGGNAGQFPKSTGIGAAKIASGGFFIFDTTSNADALNKFNYMRLQLDGYPIEEGPNPKWVRKDYHYEAGGRPYSLPCLMSEGDKGGVSYSNLYNRMTNQARLRWWFSY